MEIRHLQHDEIDNLKWDKRIRDSYNGIVFAFSWYLDIVSEGWEALVTEDYEFVMPLPVKHTLGVDYVSLPKFISQLGVFTSRLLTREVMDAFLEAIPYPFFNYRLSVHNPFNPSNFFRVKAQNNFRVDLIMSYTRRKKHFSTDFKAALVKAISQNVAVQSGLQPNDFINFMQTEASLPKKFNQDEIDTLRRIVVSAMRYRVGALYGAYSKENSLCAVAFLVGSHNKNFLLTAAANKTGQRNNALYLFFDVYFENSSEYNVTLDLDGLKVAEAEKICNGIGAAVYPLNAVDQNNMPWYVKVLKI